jgi:cytoskeleton protein RodZ
VLYNDKSRLANQHAMMSTVSSPSGDGPEAVRSGADLRAARERLGWALPDVAACLRIALSHLEALEDGRISALPGNAYAVGYVRSYAGILGLDAEEMVRRFKAEASEVERKTDLTFPVPMPDRGLPAGAVMLVGVLLCIFAYVGWYRLSGEGRLPPEVMAPIPERLARLAQQALPPAPVPSRPAPAAPVTVAANPVGGTPGQPPGPVAGQSAAPAPSMSASADPAPMRADPAPAVQPISPSSAAAALVHDPAADALTQANDKGRILLRATADAWIQVKDRNGNLLLNRILKAGETWPVPRQDNLLLTTPPASAEPARSVATSCSIR